MECNEANGALSNCMRVQEGSYIEMCRQCQTELAEFDDVCQKEYKITNRYEFPLMCLQVEDSNCLDENSEFLEDASVTECDECHQQKLAYIEKMGSLDEHIEFVGETDEIKSALDQCYTVTSTSRPSSVESSDKPISLNDTKDKMDVVRNELDTNDYFSASSPLMSVMLLVVFNIFQ